MKLIKAFFRWLFSRGYVFNYEKFNAKTGYKFGALYKKATRHVCKVCGKDFYSTRKQPTCARPKCFISYRIK